jgi:mannose-6-phosphate isomerase-like protein (cupin superfamily)
LKSARRRRAVAPPRLGPLQSWFGSRAGLERFRRRVVGRSPAVLTPLDDAWRSIVPDFDGSLALVRSGLPFHAVRDRDHDRSPDPRKANAMLARGRTLFLVQPHQVLPRLARLVTALRAALLGPFRTPCSFVFLASGAGREGMGLHHDGDVDSFWLQIEGRRTVTIGTAVEPGTPETMSDRSLRHDPGCRTFALEPGSLFHMPPRTPHRVVCFERSLAVSLTWQPPDAREALGAWIDAADVALERGRSPVDPKPLARLLRTAGASLGKASRDPIAAHRLLAAGLATWDVAPGRPMGVAPRDPSRLWIVKPAVAGPLDRRSRTRLVLAADGARASLPSGASGLAGDLARMPSLGSDDIADLGSAVAGLVESGIAAFRDLPIRIDPADPAALDGWNFA